MRQWIDRFCRKQSTETCSTLLIFGLLYYAAVVIGLASRVESIAIFWPANGIAFGFFISVSKRHWPHYVVVLAIGYLAGMFATGDYSWQIILGALAANIVQTLSGAWLVKRFLPYPLTFSTTKEILVTFLFTAVIGSLLSACFSVLLLGPGFMDTPFELWSSGVIDNAGSTVLTLPFVLLWLISDKPWTERLRTMRLPRGGEAVVFILVTVVVTEYLFSVQADVNSMLRTLPYLLIPIVLWSAFRFAQSGVALTVLFIGGEAVRHTLLAEGPFAEVQSGFILVINLHLFLSVTTLTGLLFAALFQEQKKAMCSLAGSIAHEVRAPFQQVLQAVEHIDELGKRPNTGWIGGSDNGQVRRLHDQIEMAKTSANKGLHVIDTILHQIKGHYDHQVNLKPISAKAVVSDALSEYVYARDAEREMVSVRVEEDFVFQADPVLQHFVLFNLLKNALYYSNRPGFSIVVSIASGAQYNKIMVKDTGPGIEKERIPLVFSSFYTFQNPNGTGLGLTFCKKTVESFGGKMVCESRLGEYTQFTMMFPPCSQGEVESIQERLPVSVHHVEDSVLHGKRLLVIDDGEINHKAVLNDLSRCPLEVDCVYSANEALALLRKKAYDMVFVDLNMPGTDGFEFVRQFRSMSEKFLTLQRVPVIGVSGDPRKEIEEKALQSGMQAFLVKPLKKQTIIGAVVQFCRRHSVNEEVPLSEDLRGDSLYSMGAKMVHDLKTPIVTLDLYSELVSKCLLGLKRQAANDFDINRDGLNELDFLLTSVMRYQQHIQICTDHLDDLWDLLKQRNKIHNSLPGIQALLTALKTDWGRIAEIQRSIKSGFGHHEQVLAKFGSSALLAVSTSCEEKKAINERDGQCVDAIQHAQRELAAFDQALGDYLSNPRERDADQTDAPTQDSTV
ncbi:MAG TPA: hypothetical protein DD979_16295 [Gammaproteobacteria bacterium]|nr:hypothetical protein [Gammaproteobacteria bacterium]